MPTPSQKRHIFRRTAASTSSSWTPAGMSNFVLWLAGDDAATISLDGSNKVSEWRDKSGNGRHGSQSTASQRPSITTVNGLNAVEFDGVDDVMSGLQFLASDQDFTAYAVAKKLGSASDVAYFICGNDAGFGLSIGSNVFDRPGALNGSVVWLSEGSGTLANGSTVRQTMQRITGTNSLVYKRGASVSQTFVTTPTPGPYTPYLLGRQSSVCQNLAICEILFFTALHSAGEQTQVNDYLNARWGTT